jgi:tetratricopeptide (TPR) repeat protein
MIAGLRASRLAAFLFSCLIPMLAMAAAQTDYSSELDKLWDFNAPEKSESRFRAELARHPAGSREAREATTQLARSLGLQRKFGEAGAALDTLVATLHDAPARIRVRYLLERGRIRNSLDRGRAHDSSGKPSDAVPWFKDAVAASQQDALPGADYYRVDALHMLGIAAPPDEQLDWNLKALAAADASTDARARGWRASLLHNLGWTFHERGDYARSLDYWQKALAAREATGDIVRIRVAKWTVARGLRSQGRLDEAEAMQRALATETERAGTPDGFIYEELAEIALARRDAAAAKPWAARAYALLKEDIWIKAHEQKRLTRLAELGGVTPDAPAR